MINQVNKSGEIPTPNIITFRGEKVYFKSTKHKFRIFEGIAMSMSVLKKLNPEMKIMIFFDDGESKECGYYLAKISSFLKTERRYANTDNDVQKILTFEEMMFLGRNPFIKVEPKVETKCPVCGHKIFLEGGKDAS